MIMSEKNKALMTRNIRVFLVISILLYWQIYENVIFLYPEYYFGKVFSIFVYTYKLIFPFILFTYSLLLGYPRKRPYFIDGFLLIFVFFLIWALFPTVISGDLISWTKLIPLFFFSIALIHLLNKYPVLIRSLAKGIITLSIISLIQYAAIHLTGDYTSLEPGSKKLTGPFGLFGVTHGNFYLPGLESPIVRLTGFWKEPSNAAGINFASFFLCRFLHKEELKTKWRYLSYLCLFAGFLTLSNAGYLAIGGAFFVGNILRFHLQSVRTKVISVVFITPVILLLLWLALFSRSYFSQNQVENNFLLAISGVRVNSYDDPNYDPTSGRLELLENTLDGNIETLIGKGVQQVGDNTKLIVSASAPFFWLTLTGYIGFILLLFRELFVWLSFLRFRKYEKKYIFLVQAYLVILLQQSVYGVWMDANYLIFNGFVFSIIYLKSMKGLQAAHSVSK